MQMNIDRPGGRAGDEQSRLDPLRTDRTASADDPEVAASVNTSEEEPVVLGPEKARAATTNRMPARVLIISVVLTAVAFAIGYLLVR